MHESVQDYFSSTIIVFLEIYAAACCTYFALYVNSMTLQNYYWRVSFGLVSCNFHILTSREWFSNQFFSIEFK